MSTPVMNLSQLEATLKAVLKTNAEQFVANNSAGVTQLTDDEITAVFASEVINAFPALPDLSANATAEQIAEREALINNRETVFQTVAQAEAQHVNAVAALRTSALAAAKSVVGGVLAGAVEFITTTVAGL